MFSTDQDNGLIPDETRLNVFLRVRGLGLFLRWAVGSTRLVWSSRVKDRIFRINSRRETRFWLGLRIELESRILWFVGAVGLVFCPGAIRH